MQMCRLNNNLSYQKEQKQKVNGIEKVEDNLTSTGLRDRQTDGAGYIGPFLLKMGQDRFKKGQNTFKKAERQILHEIAYKKYEGFVTMCASDFRLVEANILSIVKIIWSKVPIHLMPQSGNLLFACCFSQKINK